MACRSEDTREFVTTSCQGDATAFDAHQLIQHILSSESYYDILKVEKDSCSVDVVRNQYIKISRLIHPDKHADKPQATVAFQKVAKAYETLRNPHTQHMYNLSGKGVNFNKDDELTDLIMHIYKEFFDGEFQTLLELVDRINAEHPELHIERTTVEQVLLDTGNLMADVDCLLGELHSDFSTALDAFMRMSAMRWTDIIGRGTCAMEIARLLIGIPWRIFKLLLPKSVTGGWESLCAFQTSVASRISSFPRRVIVIIYLFWMQLWALLLGFLDRFLPWHPTASPIWRPQQVSGGE